MKWRKDDDAAAADAQRPTKGERRKRQLGWERRCVSFRIFQECGGTVLRVRATYYVSRSRISVLRSAVRRRRHPAAAAALI